ncbi:MAG: (d)CMP kinase [Christensenellales bacterium]
MAKKLADTLGIHILDTGALFRALALCALRQNVRLR